MHGYEIPQKLCKIDIEGHKNQNKKIKTVVKRNIFEQRSWQENAFSTLGLLFNV